MTQEKTGLGPKVERIELNDFEEDSALIFVRESPNSWEMVKYRRWSSPSGREKVQAFKGMDTKTLLAVLGRVLNKGSVPTAA